MHFFMYLCTEIEMNMKKTLITLTLMMALATAALADDYPYLAFQTADGTVKAVSVTSLTLTFSNGQLVATNGDGTYSFSLADLNKMFFTNEPTAVPSPLLWDGEGETVEVFSLTGISLGTFRSIASAQEQLTEGVYVVKSGSEIRKMLMR